MKYGGTERVIWCLGKELVKLGHQIDYLVKEGSKCPFATRVLAIDQSRSIESQVPNGYDIIHFNFNVNSEELNSKHIVTIHGNTNEFVEYNRNAVFVSNNHAERHQSESFVYNGLDFEEYGKVDFETERKYLHFLGNIAWKEKNSKGAIEIAKKANESILMLGGNRLSTKMGVKFFPQLNARFKGFINDANKNGYLNGSKGLVFPVRWHEPFGLSMIESLYYGCPVFGTPYGSLPEIISDEVGFLSKNSHEIAEAIKEQKFDKLTCHNYAVSQFNSKNMATAYLKKYEQIMDGEYLNSSNPMIKEKSTTRLLDFE